MDEDQPKKRIDLSDESGVTRRDILRRGALAGGALLWVAPAIRSIAPAQAAARIQGPSPGGCASCYCWNTPTPGSAVIQDLGILDGAPSVGLPALFSHDDCQNFCQKNAPYASRTGPKFAFSAYCHGTAPGKCKNFSFTANGSGLVTDLLNPGELTPGKYYGVACS